VRERIQTARAVKLGSAKASLHVTLGGRCDAFGVEVGTYSRSSVRPSASDPRCASQGCAYRRALSIQSRGPYEPRTKNVVSPTISARPETSPRTPLPFCVRSEGMPDDAIASAWHVQVVSYSNGQCITTVLSIGGSDTPSRSVAAFAFLAWEACITFPDEVDFIWS
jgi:hypothetical protein